MFPSFFRRKPYGTKKSNIEKNADEVVNEKDTSRTFRLSGQQHSTCQNPADISVGTSNCRRQENCDEEVNIDIPMVLYRDAQPPTAVAAAHLNPSLAAFPSTSFSASEDHAGPLPLFCRGNNLSPNQNLEPSNQSSRQIQTGKIRDGDATLGLSKYCIETDLRDCSPEAESFRHQHSTGLKDSQMFTSQFPIQSSSEGYGTQPGSPVGDISPRLAFLKSHDAGRYPHIHIHVNGVHNSASASTFSSPVLSPRRLGHKEDQQQKKHWLSDAGTNHSRQVSRPNSFRESDSNSPSDSLPLSQSRQRSGSSPRAQSRGTATSTPLSPCSSDISPWSPCKAENGASAGNWQKGCLLGCGSFGKVYKGIHSKTGEFCAMKEVELIQDDPNSQESAKQIAQEIMLLSSLRHPNIVHYKGSEMICRNLYIYLELVSGGSIHKLCQEFTRLEEPIIRRYTRQILQGLCFLHSNHTVHRDIKGANILVDRDGTVKLADFGIAKHIKKQGSPLSLKGSPYWMAPEAIMQKNTGHEFAIDIWSLGCTVIEMFTGKPPYSEFEKVVAMFKVANTEIPPIPLSLSPEGHSFVRCCLQKDPAKRPSAASLLDHPFVQISNDGPESVPHAFNIPDSLWLRTARGNEKFDHTGNSKSFTREGPQNTSTSEQRKIDGPALSIYPSRSAPVSPRSLYQSHGGLIPAQLTSVLPAFATNSRHAPQEGVLHTPSQDGCLHAAGVGALSMHPSRSAPVSPRTFYHSHGGLIPTQLPSLASGLATNPRHAPQEGVLHAQSQHVCPHAAGESARYVNCRSPRCFTQVASGNVSTRELGGAGNSRSFTRGPQNTSTRYDYI
ncbi:hypothetical protein KP509_12G074600 [Ceratopteris richardii]|uniref:mitogen-activated protein kinase kinase kinase n=1 Tax=Ceratopteris richardii TaxID=49495 RepID=A0A8T2TQ21_CERRI|nr:hypothetical protein KP509_12G074600 [Ceratopteris richardii]